MDIYSRRAEEDFYTGLSPLGEWIIGGSDTRRGGGPGFTPWSISFLVHGFLPPGLSLWHGMMGLTAAMEELWFGVS